MKEYKNLIERRLYKVLQDMKSRCYNPKNNHYQNYGAKGIKICNEWLNNYLEFEKWALANGYDENAPRGKCTIDRIDNKGDYCPKNCRWVDMKTQHYNTTRNVYVTANGETLTLMEWAKKLNVRFNLLQRRKSNGWSDNDIINTPSRKRNFVLGDKNE